jgi:hypothetical protein
VRGFEDQNGSVWRFLEYLKERIAGGRVHGLGVGYHDYPHSGLVGFHGDGLAKRANLIYFDENAGWPYPNDIRVVVGFNFST